MIDASRALRQTAETARTSLLSIGDERASDKPDPGKWSFKEILGHLVDSAANNHQRIVRMQERPDIGTFTYSQQHWVSSQHYHDRPWAELVELWYQLNRHLAHVIAHVDPASLSHSCDMGYAAPATLSFVAEDYVRHVRHHVEQILGDSDPRQRRKWVAGNPRT